MLVYFSKETVCFLLLLISLCDAEAEIQSLSEAIDVGTSKEFDQMFDGEGGSLKKMLDLFHKRTLIEESYIDDVFMSAAKVQSIDDLGAINVDTSGAVDFINKVIKHFQKHPNAGRKEEPIILAEDHKTKEPNDDDNLSAPKEEL